MLMKIGGMGGAQPAVSNSSAPTAHLFLIIGNSHNIGRDAALGGDVFPANVWQWTQGNILAQPSAAMLDHIDDVATDFTPDLSFSQDYAAANPAVDRIVFVPYSGGGTGFVTGEWAYTDTPNLLSAAVARYNAAYAQLVSDGFAVTAAGVFYHNANLDYDTSDYDTHRDDIDGLVAYLRVNLMDGASIPVVIGGGMNNTQLSGRTTNDALFQANLLGAEYRNAGVASYDTINPRYGYSVGIPIGQSDSIHADRAGEIVKGHLRYNALLRAAVNTAPNDPFESLSSWADWDAFIDFRSGTGRDMTGNDNHTTRVGVPLIRFDAVTEQLVYDRPGGSDRYMRAGSVSGASYTKTVFVKFDTLVTQGLMMDNNGETRFFLSNSANQVRAYHLSSSDRVDFSQGDLTAGQYYLITVTYDSASTTMKLYLDGVLKDTNSSVGAHSLSGGEYIGAQNGAADNPLDGDMLFVAYSEEAFDDPTVSALNTAAQGLVVQEAGVIIPRIYLVVFIEIFC